MYSGQEGVDSNYLVEKLLKEGHEVYAGYVSILNNDKKKDLELKAIQKLEIYFANKFPETFYSVGTIAELSIMNPYRMPSEARNNLYISQVLLWLTVAIYCVAGVDRIAFGFILHDGAVSFLDDLKAVYNTLQGFRKDKLPELEFPLIKMHKSHIYDSISPELIPLSWFCEEPIADGVCGVCSKCADIRRFCENNWVAKFHFKDLYPIEARIHEKENQVREFHKELKKDC